MEEAEVKQLISLIESAQLQYEVDESGTVSIVCDPVQLVDTPGIDNEDGNVDISSNSLLTPHDGAPIPTRQETIKDEADNIILKSQEGNDEKELEENKETKEGEEKICNQHQSEDNVAQPTAGSASPFHYFLQTPSGDIIEVLESLENISEEHAEGVNQTLEGITTASEDFSTGMEGTRDENMQILVVSNCSGGDMFLINASEKNAAQDNSGTLDVSQAILKTSASEETITDYPINRDSSDIGSTATDDINVKDSEKIFLDVIMEDDPSISKSSSVSSKYPKPQVKTSLQRRKPGYTKDSTLDTSPNNKHYVKFSSQTKPRLPLRDSVPSGNLPSTLAEGSLVQTDKGEMVAYNLSSVTKEEETAGKRTALQNIAASYGSWVKVLRPVDQEKESDSASIKKRFTLFSCDDCGAVLHSERSFKIHRRRFHEEWDDECFICGEKFLNLHYVRNHIKQTHKDEKMFECRFCSFRCSLLKEFFKHCRIHKKSQICGNCGKKYASPKVYQDHVLSCNSKKELEFSSVSDAGCNNEMKVAKSVDKKEHFMSYQNPLDIPCSRRKSGKLNQSSKKRDLEYKVESKHYSQQIKKMALEQPTRNSSRGRDRTHRCYLCFKFFSNKADLVTHKEVYHQVKSSHPVRVKTDDSLGREDEDALGVSYVDTPHSLGDVTHEEVQIKPEPPDITEKIENVTIVLDEGMNLSQVIKPICIACKTYTKTDYRDSCKVFQNVSKYDQLEALKNFEKFLPCAIDPESLVGPWVLCKKCSVLIDKIADMEEKLSAMKSDLMLRLQGSLEISNLNVGKCIDENYLKREQVDKNSNGDIVSAKVSDDVDKSLIDIEAYMKENCEIMEIIRPQRKNRNRRKCEEEKLTPILLSDDEHEEFTLSAAAKLVLQKDESNFVKGERNTKEILAKSMLTTVNIKKEVTEDLIEKAYTIQGTNIKSEPLQHDMESVLQNTVASAWESTEGDCVSPEEQLPEDDFLLPVPKAKKKEVDSELFSAQLLSKQIDSELSQSSPGKKGYDEVLDNNNTSQGKECQVKEASVMEHTDLPSGSQGVFSKVEVKPDEEDSSVQFGKIQDVLKDLETKEHSKIVDKGMEEVDSVNLVETPSQEVKQKEEKETKVSCQEPLLKVSGGKKRAKLREERNQMCYRLEGNVAKPWVCSGCHKGFSSQRGACDHYAASHGGQSYSCEQCSASYVRKRDLIGHYNKVHFKAKPYKCRKCSESFSMHSQLYKHMQSAHLEEKKEQLEFKCHICDASFSQKRYRDAHVVVCETKGSDVSPYICVLCDKSFKLERYLRLHMRTAHSVKSDAFFCELCNKVLNDKRNLILHMKSHNGETKTSCEICNKQFSRKAYLWTHMRVHTNERPYGCNYCPKWFKQYSTWKNHERTHTGEKPYKCNVCNSCFASSSSVSKHLQYAHYNIRDFGCTVCKKHFISNAKLEEHMKTHTGEKPFKCPICNRPFNKKTNLRTHMYIHSTNKRFKCELCGEGFMRRTAIENHIIERHGELDIFLGTNTSSADKGKTDTVAAATSPFISVVGADEVHSEDTYIVVYADGDKEAEISKDMQVTVLAEDVPSTPVKATCKQLSLSVVQDQTSGSLTTNVVPELMMKAEETIERSKVIPSLIANEDEMACLPIDETPTQITYL